MKPGYVISGAGHAALIALILFGGAFGRDRLPPVEVADVQVISAEDFAALTRLENGPEPTPDLAAVAPEEPARAEPEEVAPQPPMDATAASAPQQAAEPEPPPEAPVVAVPDVPESPAPAAESPDAGDPSPQEAPRVAPEPAPAPPDAAEEAPVVAEAVAPEPSPEADEVIAEQAPAAPEEATTEIVTEADEPVGPPEDSLRPRSRPQRSAALVPPEPPRTSEASSIPDELEPDPEPPAEAPEPEPAEPEDDRVAEALAARLAATEPPGSAPQQGAPAGPPLTSGEKDALRIAVQDCWNLGSLSSEAMRTTVIVSVRMTRDAKPDTASIRLEGFQGGGEGAARQAFEAARRAIIRCSGGGYPLPPEKYAQWAEIEMTFNPENMRIR